MTQNFHDLAANDATTALLINVITAVGQFQPDLQNELAVEGIAAAEAEGRYWGRPPALARAHGVSGAAVRTGLTDLLPDKPGPVLLQGILEAADGDGTTLLAMAGSYNGRDADGHYNNMQDAFTAISCADTTERPIEKDSGEPLPCTGWPVKGDDAAKEAAAPGAAPIVVIGKHR